jgi:hypothetical protein
MHVAVKVLTGAAVTDAQRASFIAEANAMAELAEHPFIVPVYRVDTTDDGQPYMIMKYYSRPNLAVRAREAPLSLEQALRIGIQIASAVETAHRAGLLHRDIKPANILTDGYGTPGLTDFGIAARIGEIVDDADGFLSLPWAAPEVAYNTAPPSVRSDVYSLAATLWHLLVGRSPFEVPGGSNEQHVLARRIAHDARPSTRRPDVPVEMDRLLARAMAIQADQRPGSALELARSLQLVEQQLQYAPTQPVIAEAPRSERPPAQQDGGTVTRPPVRIEAQPSAPLPAPGASARGFSKAAPTTPAQAPDERTLAPARAPATPAPRRRVFGPSEEAAEATQPAARPAADDPPIAEPPLRRGRGRGRAVTGFVGALLVVGGIVVTRQSGGETPAAQPTPTPPAQDALVAAAPASPVVTAHRTGPTTVAYTWTYDTSQPLDGFRWRTVDQAQSGATKTPGVDLTIRAGASACLQGLMVATTQTASSWSSPSCPG